MRRTVFFIVATAVSIATLQMKMVTASFMTRSSIRRIVRKSTALSLVAPHQYPILAMEEEIMNPKAHGTSNKPVQKDLLFGMDFETADRICNFNRRYAEYKGYCTNYMNFLGRKATQVDGEDTTYKFHDSVTGNLLFTAPVGRTLQEFVEESKAHGWPSFRDEEVNWEYVRCLEGHEEECVSITGTHLGHNIPDENGNRYCINLVSIAGRPNDEIEVE